MANEETASGKDGVAGCRARLLSGDRGASPAVVGVGGAGDVPSPSASVSMWAARHHRPILTHTAGWKKAHFKEALIAQLVKNPPAMQETVVRFLGREDPLEKGQATHSSIAGLPLWFS